jgi:hypothetical protein
VIVVWGWRVRHKTLSEGTFFSPATGQDGPYRLVEARRWFTLFWIPLIPLKVVGTFVECGVTKNLFDPKILEAPTNAQLVDDLASAAREVVAAVASADGAVTARQRKAALEVVGSYNEGYDKDSLRADIGRVDDVDLSARLGTIAGSLTEQGKERLLDGAARVLVADGDPGERGREVLDQVGAGLGMSAAHVRGVVDTAVSAAAG